MDPSQLQPGYRLDRYELLCPLAYGGMASVWLARFGGRLGFERMVVIKMILPQYSQDPRFQEMFLDEARIASRIEHSNVARILDVGEHQENYFIVMEWVDGDSLSKVLRAAEQRRESIPVGVAMRIVADAAAGLHAAHELKDRDGTHLGVVHRDVSPQNILVANNGATMIIDFGVAKARDRISQETSAGQLKGKIRYMAPEQALGRPIDHRADVWALGAMLYEMFTGSPPYDGPNEVATLHKLTSGQRPAPPPDSMPAPLRRVLARALGYEPDDRFATALELNQALESAMVEINEPTTSAMVAHYTGQLLADRKGARKRAVDGALENARQRDQASPNFGAYTPSAGIPFSATASSRSFTPAGRPPQTGPGRPNESPSMPGAEAGSLQEMPSMPSNATLGSANMEYLPNAAMLDDSARSRRYIIAASLGVLLAAGVIGAVLIVTTIFKPSHADHAATAAPTQMTAAATDPPATPAASPPPAPSSEQVAAPEPTEHPTAEPPPPTTGAAATATSSLAASAGRTPPVHVKPADHTPVVRPVQKAPASSATSKYGF